MTQDSARPRDGNTAQDRSDAELLAALWEQAPFPRLPRDAPSELRDLVEDVDDPRRVYAIHRASRRHNFQALVQKFVVQLRDGCGTDYCITSTCFSCRRRIVGRAPIRRYNTTSARILAVHLASQDNPENALCPNLKSPKSPPAAVKALKFVPKGTTAPILEEDRYSKSQNGHARGGLQRTRSNGAATKSVRREGKDRPVVHDARTAHNNDSDFSVSEEPISKDHRSFAANVFGTVAFKMLEWLTPSGVAAMSKQTQRFGDCSSPDEDTKSPPSKQDAAESRLSSPYSTPETLAADQNGAAPHTSQRLNGSAEIERKANDADEVWEEKEGVLAQRPSTDTQSGLRGRTSAAKVRTSSRPKPKRQLSIDPLATETNPDDPLAGALRSAHLAGLQGEKSPRALKSTASSLSRPISQLSSAGFFDDVPLETMPPPKSQDVGPKHGRPQLDGNRSLVSTDLQEPATNVSRSPSNRSTSPRSLLSTPEAPSVPDMDVVFPQALLTLNADIVDFLCDVLQEDSTAEAHLLEPQGVTKFHKRFAHHGNTMRRRSSARAPYPVNMKLEWKLFAEHSFFYVLSDPQLAIASFAKKGQLYDSQTLWYCMLRLTRVAPTLVFHSLWMASRALFAPPKQLQSLRSPTARLFPKDEDSLSNAEAGSLMSICLHALVAAAPVVSDSRELYDISRIRSHGLSLAGSGAIARQPSALCLQYDDAFSNDLAIRLARRLFAAITTRRHYDDMKDCNTENNPEEPDILAPTFAQLDFLNTDAVYVLNFSFPDRALHEARVPTLLLDWARAVMFHDWDGSPEVPGDGPFGGALALIEAMYERRQVLLLGDAQFRSEYFADRLDAVQMPVSWLSFSSTKKKLHLLDFPYIFSASTLVSYFRSINFSRMSRSFEESSSLQGRMGAVLLPGRLIVNPHQKEVLEDLLQTASSRYLILGTSRDNVLRDTFDQLWRRQRRELMRPLKVRLGEGDGEEGFDSGGVQQEFFRLAMAEALNPDYGAFTVDERTRMTWFQPGSIEAEWKFELIGLLVSLAVYNGLTLPVTFPKALYRKLLNEPVTELHHIADGWPDLANGLTTLLEWDEKDGLVEDVFARTYEFSVSMFDDFVSREMRATPSAPASPRPGYSPDKDEDWPQFPKTAWQSSVEPALHEDNPPEAPLVTNANRNAYVSDYIRYLTDVSVRPQYEAFARGFRTCLHPKSLTLLTSTLLQSIVEGVQDIDVSELRRHARYVGWDASHRTVRDFWSIVKRYDDSMKRKLLEFVTASDRVPVGGMKNLQFVVQRNGEEEGDGGHLPTAYTCYGTLLLPEYRDKEVLRERLAMALQNAQGFGFA